MGPARAGGDPCAGRGAPPAPQGGTDRKAQGGPQGGTERNTGH